MQQDEDQNNTNTSDQSNLEETIGKQANTDNTTPSPMVINGQYIKDLSFEVPQAPKIFATLPSAKPDIKINVDVKAQNVSGNTYEVVLEITANCSVNDSLAFILELVYGGLFTLNVRNDYLQPMLLIECPRQIFPFARNIVADISRDGGFPPVMLGPIDFAKMYHAEIDKQSGQDHNS